MADDFDALFAGGSGASKAAPVQPAGAGDDFDHLFSKGTGEGHSAGVKAVQPFVGFNETVANMAGFPVDAANWAMGKVGLPVSDHPFMGSESIKRGMGLIGANPDDPRFAAQTTGEKVLRGVGSGVASVVAPEAAIQGGARAIGAKVGPLLEQLVGSGASPAATGLNAAAAGVGGGIGEAAQEAAPDSLKPLAGLAGNLLGAGAIIAPAVGARAGLDYLKPKVSQWVEPFSASGRQTGAAREFTDAFQDPHAALNKLDDLAAQRSASGTPDAALGEGVAGEKFTTPQLTQDRGALSAERAISTKSPEDFRSNEYGTGADQQNAARVEAFSRMQQRGTPEDVANFLRQQRDELDAHYGAAEDTARQKAEGLGSQVGTGAPAEAVGSDLRGALQQGLDAAKAKEDALWSMVPKDSVVVAKPIAEASQAIAGRMTPSTVPMGATEKHIFDVAAGYGDHVTLGEVGDLRSSISQAMREARRNGDDRSLARLTQLRGSVEDAIDQAVTNQSAWEREQVQRGAMQVGDTTAARLREWINATVGKAAGRDRQMGTPGAAGVETPGTSGASGAARYPGEGSGGAAGYPGVSTAAGRAPQHLMDFARKLGGIQDEGGDLQAMGLNHLVNNRTGVPLDEARARAAEAGYLGAHTDDAMANTTTTDFLDALSNGEHVYSVHDEGQLANHEAYKQQREARAQARQAQAEILDQSQKMGLGAPDRATLRAATQHMTEDRLPWDDALERAQIGAYNRERDAQLARSDRLASGTPEFDLFPGDIPGTQMPKGPTIARPPGPIVDEQGAKAIKDASAATREKHETYRQGALKNVLQSGPVKGAYTMSDAAVPSKIFKQGPEGGQVMQAYLKGAGQDGLTAATNAAGESLRQAAAGQGGLIDAAKFETWVKNHRAALSVLPPEVAAKFRNAAEATKAVNEAALARKNALRDYQAGAVGKVLGLTSGEDVKRTVGGIFQAKNPVDQMTSLAKQVAKSPDAAEGLRKAIADTMADKLMSSMKNAVTDSASFKPGMFTKFVRQQEPVLRAGGMKDEQIAILHKIADGYEKSASTLGATRLPGQSNTAQDLVGLMSRMEAKNADVGWMVKAVGALFAGHPLVAAGVVGHHGSEVLRGSGLDKMSEVVREAVYNPEFGRALLHIGLANRAVQQRASEVVMRRALARQGFAAGIRGTQPKEEAQGFAKGGLVSPSIPAPKVAPNFLDDLNAAVGQRMMGGVSPGAIRSGLALARSANSN